MENLEVSSGCKTLESYNDSTKQFQIFSEYSNDCLFEGKVKSRSLRNKITKSIRDAERYAAYITKHRIIVHIEDYK